MLNGFRTKIQRSAIYARWRAAQQEEEYRRWRESYAQRRTSPRFQPPTLAGSRKILGQVRTFAVIPNWGWHDTLMPELESLGPVERFDYAPGITPQGASRYNATFLAWRKASNDKLLQAFEQAHARKPFDWVFAYCQGDHLLAHTVHTLRSKYHVPCVNMCLDDKNSWDADMPGVQRAGSKGLVAAFDLWWTSARICVDWVAAENGSAIYLPEGCTPSLFPETELPYAIPISFVGACYGRRPEMIAYLREHGVPVQVFGRGWGLDSEVSAARMSEIFRTSQINLGHGGMACSETIMNVKGRDFEVPCAGGGVYLTTFNPDLAQHFYIGEEILCWRHYDDLLEQIRFYLARPEECRAIARRARKRCLREHRWRDRFIAVLHKLGVLCHTSQQDPS